MSHIVALPPKAVGADSAPTAAPRPHVTWQQEVKEAIRDPRQLCQLLGLPEPVAAAAEVASADFPLFVPRPLLARMRRGDPADPLLRQVLPLAAETQPVPGYDNDPLDEQSARRAGGLLHKYAGRVLMVTTGACAVHCRYCFRRHFPYQEMPRSLAGWEPALEQIAADDSIGEVILSGGDPLMLVDELLAPLAERIAAIAHVRRLRVHTRLPIVIPQRVNESLLGWLRGTRLAPVMVVHANHPAELDKTVAEALGSMVDAGIPVLNQAVLLRGVNDSADTLAALCERLVDLRVMPYYLHQLDRVAGAAHFHVPVDEGRRIIEQLRWRLPGYAVPQYVREVAGEMHKIPI